MFGSGGLDEDEEDLVEVVDEMDEVEIFRRTVGEGGLKVREVSSDATLEPRSRLASSRLLP